MHANTKPLIIGVAGTSLSAGECALFAQHPPFGLILFKRNIVNAAQVQALIAEFRTAVGNPNAPVLIDQEGGRVARLRAPLWAEFPPPLAYAALYQQQGAAALALIEQAGFLMGAQLRALGITVNCAPMLDVPAPNAHTGVIGDRVFGADVATIVTTARAYTNGLRRAGVLPIMKHLPGHGRAVVDSHDELPHVSASYAELSAADFATFKALRDLCDLGMTAHVVYQAIDDQPATQSAKVIGEVIRAEIGFNGILIADTIEMKALQGSMADRMQRSFAAGCDLVLYCPGDYTGLAEVLAAAPVMTADLAARWQSAAQSVAAPAPMFDDRAHASLMTAIANLGNSALTRTAAAPTLAVDS